jgi:hypothetical protein
MDANRQYRRVGLLWFALAALHYARHAYELAFMALVVALLTLWRSTVLESDRTPLSLFHSDAPPTKKLFT